MMTLAYEAADQGDFKEARRQMLAAADANPAAGAASADFGTAADQATYQAAVALQASGDTNGAVAEYVHYLEERPNSPLCHAVHRRLVKLAPERADEFDAMLQKAITAQEDAIQRRRALCGPIVAVEFLKRTGRQAPGVQAMAELAKTDDSGSSMAGLQRALAAQGVRTVGLRVNRADFGRLMLPTVWLRNGHYLLAIRHGHDRIRVYDPLLNRETDLTIPPSTDTEFTADVLTVAPTSN